MSIIIHRDTFEGRDYYVCLPPSYPQGDRHYPVVYMQDGDRLLPVLGDILDAANGNGKGICLESIIVGAISAEPFGRLYPLAALALRDSAPAFGGLGDSYLQFLADGLKPHVDAVYRTLPEPSHTCGGVARRADFACSA